MELNYEDLVIEIKARYGIDIEENFLQSLYRRLISRLKLQINKDTIPDAVYPLLEELLIYEAILSNYDLELATSEAGQEISAISEGDTRTEFKNTSDPKSKMISGVLYARDNLWRTIIIKLRGFSW